MALVKCNNGHFYNDDESASCPYCSGAGSIGQTIPLGQTLSIPDADNGAGIGGAGETVALGDIPTADLGGSNIPETVEVKDPVGGRTIFIDDQKNSSVKPVRGWLIVTEGDKCGLDFRIHVGQNSVGRSNKNDIAFDFDQTISKDKCCFFTYDDRSKMFYLRPGEGTNNIYVNNQILLQPMQINDYDVIEIGRTKFVFRSLCNDKFDY